MKLLQIGALLTATLSACGGGGGAPASLPASSSVPTRTIAVVGDSISTVVILPDSNPATCVPGAWRTPGACDEVIDPARAYPAVVGATLGASIANLATPSVTTEWMRANEVPKIPLDASAVVYEGGTNDIVFGQGQDVRPRVDAIAAAIHARVPRARIVFVTVRSFGYPQSVPFWNERERSVAAQYGAAVVDLETDPQWYVASEWPDGLHPSPAAVQRLGFAVAQALR